MVSLLEAINEGPIKYDETLPGLLPGSAGLLVAPGSTGKGFASLQLGVSVACPESIDPFFGELYDGFGSSPFDTDHSGPVSVLMAEDPSFVIHNRLHYIGETLKEVPGVGEVTLEKTNENLCVGSLTGQLPRILTAGDTLSDEEKEWREKLFEWCENQRLVILDPLARFHSADENHNGKMTTLVQLLEQVAQETKTAIIFTHHANKQSMWSDSGDQQSAARGASALTDAVRWQVNMCGMSEDEAQELDVNRRRKYVRFSLPKINFNSPIDDFWLERSRGGTLKYVDFKENDSVDDYGDDFS
ncbi:MAG: helicase RepA family protein [bacterium]